jgi:hypothetical protein
MLLDISVPVNWQSTRTKKGESFQLVSAVVKWQFSQLWYMYVLFRWAYEGVSKSFRTGRLERELQTVQLSATKCIYIAIFWVSLVSFAAITLCLASQRVFIVVNIYFVIHSVRKLLDTPSYTRPHTGIHYNLRNCSEMNSSMHIQILIWS